MVERFSCSSKAARGEDRLRSPSHTILVIVYHLLAMGSCYEEARYDHCHPKQEARERQRAIKALERLGYTVTVERAA